MGADPGTAGAREAYVALHQQIQPATVVPAIGHLNQLVAEGVQRIVLLMQTIGGDIDAGVVLYERLRSLPCHLVTHAFGEVASMGVPIYLAGEERLVGPQCGFVLHRPGFKPVAEEWFDIPKLENHIAALRADEKRTTAIYVDRTSLAAEEVQALKASNAKFGAAEAVRLGIAHRVQPFILPSGHNLVGIGRPNETLATTAPPPGS